jgi:hypothetical protein
LNLEKLGLLEDGYRGKPAVQDRLVTGTKMDSQ